MSALGAAAITAGATVASGLLGRRKTKTQWDFEERSRLEKDRFKWLVKGAQKAGFNPLTVLNATGGGMGGGPVATSTPFAARQAVADAIAAGANAYLAYDPVEEETRELENDLLRKQIQQYENEAGRFGNQPIGAPVPAVRKSASPTQSAGPSDVENPYGTQAYDATGKPLIDAKSYNIYDALGHPGEVETDYFGAYRMGQLADVAMSDLERNFPRVANTVRNANNVAQWTYDQWAKLPTIVDEVRKKPIVRPARPVEERGYKYFEIELPGGRKFSW